MTNYHTNSSIVERVVCLSIEERILKDTCREADFVGCWVVVCVYCLWRHHPLVAVNRLTSLWLDRELVPELSALKDIVVVWLLRVDGKSWNILPLVRISNLYIESSELVESGSLGSLAHPVLCLDTFSQTCLKVLHQLLHTSLRLCREILLAIHLAKRLAQNAVYLWCSTLPEWQHLGTSAHCLAIEIEVSAYDLVAKIRCRTADYVPLNISLELCCALCSDELIYACEEVWLTNYEFCEAVVGNAFSLELLGKTDMRIVSLKLLDGHLVVVSLYITKLSIVLGNESQCSLIAHDEVSILLSLSLWETVELEHLSDVLLESVADFCCSLIVLKIIFLFAKG